MQKYVTTAPYRPSNCHQFSFGKNRAKKTVLFRVIAINHT